MPATTVLDAADSGDRLEVLTALRAVLARALDSSATPPHAIAQLTRQVSEIDREIRGMAEDADGANREVLRGDEPFDPMSI